MVAAPSAGAGAAAEAPTGRVTRAVAALRLLRNRLHARAYALHHAGREDAAQVLWVLVEELDDLTNLLTRRR